MDRIQEIVTNLLDLVVFLATVTLVAVLLARLATEAANMPSEPAGLGL